MTYSTLSTGPLALRLHYTPKRFQTAGELLRALRYRKKKENGFDAHRSLLIVWPCKTLLQARNSIHDLLLFRECRIQWRSRQSKQRLIRLSKGHSTRYGVALHHLTARAAMKQVETSVDTARSGIAPSVLNSFGAPCAWAPASIYRRTRPHKFWAFTNLECLDRSLGPLYLISACFALIEVEGALCHLRMHLWMCLELLLTNEEGGRWECDCDGGCSYGCLIYCHLTWLSALLPSLCIQQSHSLSLGGSWRAGQLSFEPAKTLYSPGGTLRVTPRASHPMVSGRALEN